MQKSLIPGFLAVQKRRQQLPPEDLTAENTVKNLVSGMMPHQRALYESKAKRDAVIAPRQVGKTMGVLLLLFAYCVGKPNQEWVLIGPTLKSLKRIYIPNVKKLNHKLNLGIAYNKSDLTLTFPNGSIIHFFSADKAEEAEKLRGAVLDGVVVDEAQLYPLAEFANLIQAVVTRTLAVRRGRLILLGTPGEVMQGEFFNATCTPANTLGVDNIPSNYSLGEEPLGLWCKHCWTPQANLVAPHLWEEALNEKRLRGWSDEHPTWRREYLGQWVATHNTMVYAEFQAHRNTYSGELPELPQGAEPWKYCLGVDLGEKDGTAMVVWAFSPSSPYLYEVYSHKEKAEEGKRITARFLANWYKELLLRFGVFEAEVCDRGGLAGMLLGTLAEEYSIVWEDAEKKQKEDHIKLLNDDFEYGIVFLRRDGELAAELPGNRWMKDKTDTVPPIGHRKEDPATPNDLCDAALYSFRWCYHRFHKPSVAKNWDALTEMYQRERDAIRQLREGRLFSQEDPCSQLS